MTRPPPSSTLFPYTTLFRSELCGGTSRGWLRGRAVGVVAKLDKVGGFRIEREPFEDQPGSSHVELAYVLFKLPGVNARAGDDGIVFLIPDRTVGIVKSAVGEPDLKPNADFQLELVLELGIGPAVLAER